MTTPVPLTPAQFLAWKKEKDQEKEEVLHQGPSSHCGPAHRAASCSHSRTVRRAHGRAERLNMP